MNKVDNEAKKRYDAAVVWNLMKDCRTDYRIRFLEDIFRGVYDEIVEAMNESKEWNPLGGKSGH